MNDIMISALFDDAPEITTAAVSGEWFPIRMTPDIATGELFNVGVAMRTTDGDVPVKLIDNARPFKCLYGQTGMENFSFLLTSLRQSIGEANGLVHMSPHFKLGEPSFAAGDNVDALLGNLFETMVSLNCSYDDAKGDDKAYTISTDALQKKVFALMKKQSPSLFERIYRPSPVVLEDSSNHPLRLELPIWNDQPDMCRSGGIRFGTIVSAYYRDKVHRHYNLDGGALTMVNAATLLNDKQTHGGIFILRPESGAIGYSDGLRNEIDNDIDAATWALQKRKNVTIKVSSDPAELVQAAMELAA